MAGILNLLEILQLPETTIDVETILTQFLTLSDADKATCRLNTAERIFPAIFGDDAIIHSDVNFSTQNETTWSTNCQLAPGIIVTPQTPRDVGKVLALCRFLDIKFSVRSGGHLHNPGFTSNNGGMVLLMKRFNTVSLSEDRLTADIGVGQTWFDVYKALEKYGLTVTGGRQPSVGVAGLLLGGGLAFQNSERGLSSHGVVEYEVNGEWAFLMLVRNADFVPKIVLADSTVAKVNATSNKDLFWALKGGGPNFGVVTKVTMSTLPNNIWCEGLIYSPGENTNLFKSIMNYHKASEKDPKANLICHFMEDATLFIFLYAGTVDHKPAVFDTFDKIECLTRVLPSKIYTVFEVVNLFANFTTTEPKSHDMRVMTSLPDLDVYNAIESCRLEQLEAVKSVHGARLIMNIQPISSSASRACDNQGGNPLGLKPESQQWLLVMVDWSHPEDEATMLAASRKIIDQAEFVAKKNGTYLDFKYSNYSSRDQDPLAAYGSENLSKLRSVAKEVDPHGVFQKLQNDGWLLSKTA
ncbi:FAD-binding, type 2 [Penicillium griseofulvum]|uniref:FAD-binding, type 2 n=1 Tax=Penicillium patulum TaxID=5078 RepID=A0A135LK12_PENPA|nr:FAD-binding, type 2 [Penicillium griseofulvum]KXG49321.1 FAD-binding, type 2 [Penicillium griseofulvum]